MKIRCPHCHHAVEVVEESSFRDVECPSCHSHFSILGEETTTETYRTETRRLGHFELIERLGIGAFGSVWKAKDTELDRIVAIKIPRKEQLSDQETELFMRDARAAAQLKHPNIVGVHEVGRDGDTIYIAMDYIEGADLKQWLRGEPLPPREAAQLMATIATAVEHAHSRGVTHRDCKPENIMMDRKGQPHVMDFGLAKRESGEITMTVDGATLGTPAYMSPEQAAGRSHEADARSDVYSLGVILYEMLTSTRPFHGEKRMLLLQILEDDPPSIRKLNSRVPKYVETICLKCLRKEPGKRYQTAADFAADLQRWLAGKPIIARPVGRLEKTWLWCKRRPALVSSAVVVLLAVLIAVGVVVTASRANEKRIAEERLVNDRARAEALVEVLLSVAPESVSYAERDLQPFREYAIPILQKSLERELENDAAVRIECLLFKWGEVDRCKTIALNAALHSAPREFTNVITALRNDSPESLQVVTELYADFEKIEIEGRVRLKAQTRLAIIALLLGDWSIAEIQVAFSPDPSRRAMFIEVLSKWHGNLQELASVARQIESPALRSAICLGVGSVPIAGVLLPQEQHRAAWRPIFVDWYNSSSDSGTHSAAAWALRQWELEIPEIDSTKDPAAGMEWHVNSIGMTMLRIASGSFVRRDSWAGPDAPEQTVTLSTEFLLSDKEVSQEQFLKFLNDAACPNEEKPKENLSHMFFLEGFTGDHPITDLSWYDAILFCNWLSRAEGLEPSYGRSGRKQKIGEQEFDEWELVDDPKGYRLPTEAEWEYACRAGSNSGFSHGSDATLLQRYAVFSSARRQVCGTKLPNAWGLFDMHGNVSEWCFDYLSNYDSQTAVTDPLPGRVEDESYLTIRINRGGGAGHLEGKYLSATLRDWNEASIFGIGFRMARNAP